MTSSRSPRQVPPPPNSKAGANYTRFIPREELQDFASWQPGSFGSPANRPSGGQAAAAAGQPAAPMSEQQQALLHAARQAGYQDGYRDGLVALDSFKHSFAQQMSGQIGMLVARFGAEFDALEQSIAAGVARIASELARQVVRTEVAARPELVAAVAQQAVNAVLMSARHIVVHVHPDDHALVLQGAGDAISARGARLVSDASIERGGVRLESDAGIVDAGIASRWILASRSLGVDLPWADPADAGSSEPNSRIPT